jgi:hypothetical protein
MHFHIDYERCGFFISPYFMPSFHFSYASFRLRHYFAIDFDYSPHLMPLLAMPLLRLRHYCIAERHFADFLSLRFSFHCHFRRHCRHAGCRHFHFFFTAHFRHVFAFSRLRAPALKRRWRIRSDAAAMRMRATISDY